MNLRDMTNVCCRLSLILITLFILGACSPGGGNSGQGEKSLTSFHEEERDGERRCDDDDDVCKENEELQDAASMNIVAVHNPSSPQYNDNCLSCHNDIPTAQSLNPTIPNAHVAMLSFTPGENSDKCVWCHRDVSNTLIHTAAQVGAFQNNIRKTVDTALCSLCHGPAGPGRPFYVASLNTNPIDGAAIYGLVCESCHGPLGNSEVKGESAQEILSKIAENEGGMGPLSSLRPDLIAAIAGALGGDTTLPPSTTPPDPGNEGATLYAQYCATCHGDLANSAKAGASSAQIQNGINQVPEMAFLSFLTTAQVDLISAALSGGGTGGGGGGGGTGGTDGAALYTQYCAACHNSLSNSDKSGASASQIQNGINNINEMNSLSFLTATQVQAIADALSGGGGGGSGGGGLPANHTDDKDGALHAPGKDTPYSSGCTACHGTTLQGDIGPSCFSCHDQKWNEDPPTGGGGTGGTDGESLYAQYCSACHRNLDDSEVRGEDKGDIEDAIDDNEGGMGALGFLSEDQIEAIADALDGDS